jgi:hypothetical protein
MKFRIPAPTVQEVRPPWIDPQCKFRWGDRVIHESGGIYYVVHPNDPTEPHYPVLLATSLGVTYPYNTQANVEATELWGDSIDASKEAHLTLYPEDLPKHYDDTQQSVKKPVECWVIKNRSGGIINVSSIKAEAVRVHGRWWEQDATIHHMREVLE